MELFCQIKCICFELFQGITDITILPLTGRAAEADCIQCTGGSYCETTGLSAPTGLCDEGWYCPLGSSSPQTTRCQPGEFCPAGSVDATPCTSGSYCSTAELAEVTGPCLEGYYCTLGASVNNPTDGSTGDVCPVGSYCPLGSGSPQSCAAGKFTNAEGNTQVSDCQDCTAGE